MRHLLLRKLLLVLFVGISACAAELERSHVRFSSDSEDVQRRVLRIPEAVTLTPSTGYSQTLKAASPLGAAVQPEIKLNGVAVGTSKPGGYFYVDRPAGKYEAHASTEVDRMVSFVLAPGETKYIRTSPSFGVLVGRIKLELMSASEAEAQMASLHYTGT